MTQIIVATRNPSKLEQIGLLLKNVPLPLISMASAGIEGEAVEDGITLGENASKKARYVHAQMNDSYVIADDTGLFIEALDGAPGIHAARWAGPLSTEAIMGFTLGRLRRATNRRATFRTVVAVVTPDGNMYHFEGEVAGYILMEPTCAPQPNMPYSSIFVPDGCVKTWAEMTIEEENAISHRGKAFRAALEFLHESIGGR